MAHGLEARSPFMDHKIAEFMAKVPVDYKVRGRSLRYLQRKLAQRYLPSEIIEFPKQGFSSPLPYLLRNEYSQLFELYLKKSELVQEGLLNKDKLTVLLNQHQSGRADHGNRLWLILNAEVWYRMKILGDSTTELGMSANSV
jgi:asparagine synthase (glutamine-hydrolysing)